MKQERTAIMDLKHWVLYANADGSYLLGAGGNTQQPLRFEDWKAVVSLFAEFAMRFPLSLNPRQSEFMQAAASRLPSDLANLRTWLVPVDVPATAEHEASYMGLLAKYPVTNKAALPILDRDIHLKPYQKQGFVLANSQGHNPALTPATLMNLMCLVLSHPETEQVCFDQYAPFLRVGADGKELTFTPGMQQSLEPAPRSSVPEAPVTAEASETQPAPAVQAAHVFQPLPIQGGFTPAVFALSAANVEAILRKHGLVV